MTRAALATLAVAVTMVLFALWLVQDPARDSPDPTGNEPGAPRLARAAPRAPVALIVIDGLRYDFAIDASRMPWLATAARRHGGGELWTGSVSMTSSGVLALGTGTLGGLEQVVHNVHPRPTPRDSWLAAARRAGLVVAAVGDATWERLYGRHLHHARAEAAGVVLDGRADERVLREAVALLALRPDALVVHLAAADHQAHVHGVRSDVYAEFLREADGRLRDFVARLSGWNVLITSDHGMDDASTHGADVDLHRRIPLVTLGPTFSDGSRLTSPARQIDVANTMAALLDVAPPMRSEGRVLGELLTPAARERITASAVEIRERSPARSSPGPRASVAMVALLALLGLVAWGARAALRPAEARSAFVVVPLAAAVSVVLTWGLERLPGSWPATLRLVLFATFAALVALAILQRDRVRRAGGRPVLSALAALTLLGIVYPASAPAVALGVLAVCLVGGRRSIPSRKRRAVATIAVLGVLAVLVTEPVLRFVSAPTTWAPLAGSAALALAVFVAMRSAGVARTATMAATGAWIALGLIARIEVSPEASRAFVVMAVAAGTGFFVMGRALVALGPASASVVVLARSTEGVWLAALLLAGTLLHLAARDARGSPLRVVVGLVALLVLTRPAVLGHFDLTGLDFRAGAFGSPHTVPWITAGAHVAEQWSAGVVLLAASQAHAPRWAHEEATACASFFAARCAVLVAMLAVCQDSYWTALRVISELPVCALLCALTASQAIAARRPRPERSYSPSRSSSSWSRMLAARSSPISNHSAS